MDILFSALADPTRWQLVGLLAERPRPVGVLAQLAEARQSQTTKHLQALERAGVVTSQRSGQRRIYALQTAPLRELAAALIQLADTTDQISGPHETYDRYRHNLHAERLAAQEPGWADGRSFTFHRSLAGRPEEVWRHLTEAPLLARWWTPDDLRVSELVFEARPGGRIVQGYRDAEVLEVLEGVEGVDLVVGRTQEVVEDSELVVGRAQGVVEDVRAGEHLAYRLSPLLADGSPAFTAHIHLDLRPTDAGTELDVRFRITDSTVESADFIAGLEIGYGQSLDKLVAAIAAD
ncbi:metalloregulator ArsR/SmtB family transcription factor [Streptosporangium sp. NPDC003464]